MKFNFKIQQYQKDAVDAAAKIFAGKSFDVRVSYIRDLGKVKSQESQMSFEM